MSDPTGGDAIGGTPGEGVQQGAFGFTRPIPDAKEVAFLHLGDDVDQGDGAHHHTLGRRTGQAAPGVALAALEKLVGEKVDSLTARGLDNRIINGDFRINQRGYVSGASLTPGVLTGYGHDRWRTANVNLIRNPSAEVNLTDWATANVVTTLTRGNAQARTGSWSFTCTAGSSGNNGMWNGAANRPPVFAGRQYTASAYGRVNVVRNATIAIRWFDVNGSAIGADVVSTPVAMTTTGWTRMSVTATAPAGAVTAALLILAASSVSTNVLYLDDVMFNEGELLPYVDRPATSYTFTQTPNGCTITLNSGGAIQQVIERANLPAGDYTVSWVGTAQARVYENSDLALLGSSATSPLTFTTDGSDDIVVEFEAVGGTATLANVNLVAGGTAYPFRPRPIGEELSLAQRYFARITAAAAGELLVTGWQTTTTTAIVGAQLPVAMRVAAIPAISGVAWTDAVGFATACTINDYRLNNLAGYIVLQFAASGAAFRPGGVRATGPGSYLDYSAEF